MSVSNLDGVRVSHTLKHVIISLLMLLFSLVIMFVIEIIKHNYQIDNVFVKILEHATTALFIAGLWHGVHEFFVKEEFIAIHDRSTGRILDAVTRARKDAKLGLVEAHHDVESYSFSSLITQPARLTVVLNDGYHWVSDHVDALRKRLNDPSKATTFLLVHPESLFVAPLCEKIDGDQGDYKKKILSTVRELWKLKKHDNLRVLGHRSIVYQSIFIADSKVVVTPYYLSKEKQNPPLFVFVSDDQESFGARIIRDIDLLEKGGSDLSDRRSDPDSRPASG